MKETELFGISVVLMKEQTHSLFSYGHISWTYIDINARAIGAGRGSCV